MKPAPDAAVYQIPNWSQHFENARSRQIERCTYVLMPNKQDGLGFNRILSEPDGASIFGIWCLILQACSRQRQRDGWLTDDGHPDATPWSPEDLAMRWRRQVDVIQRALDVLSSDKVGWLKKMSRADVQVTPECRPADVQVNPERQPKSSRAEESGEDRRGEEATSPPQPCQVTKEEKREQFRKLLLRHRLACNEDAMEEWTGFARSHGADTIDAAMDLVDWSAAEAQQDGLIPRFARELEAYGRAWERIIAKLAKEAAQKSGQPTTEAATP